MDEKTGCVHTRIKEMKCGRGLGRGRQGQWLVVGAVPRGDRVIGNPGLPLSLPFSLHPDTLISEEGD